MTNSPAPTQIDEELLPQKYDRLVPVDRLIHGEHNPRRVNPTDELRRSIAQSGINRALIVRPDDEADVYHVTDGWQRYQAAVTCGWEELPVRLFDTPLAALEATETESIVREWSTYDWAQYCQSVAIELDGESRQHLVEQVAERTTKSPTTVRRYLDVLSLPTEIRPLLTDGPEGSEQDWTALRNYNDEVRRYDGLPWTVASHLARRQSELTQGRVIGIAAKAVTFDRSEDAIEFIDLAADNPGKPLDIVRREALFGQNHPRYLEVPRTVIPLEREQKQALMDYCCEQRQSLTDIVTESLESLAAELNNDAS